MRKESIEKIQELVDKIDMGMFVTISDNVELRARPMSTQQVDDQGVIWFFTSDDTGKIEEIIKQPQVNLSYSSPSNNTYLSVSGEAVMVRDKEKMRALFSPVLRAWYPKGLKDSSLVLIKVLPQKAEYWEGSGKLVELFNIGKALLKEEVHNYGNTGKLS